MASTLCTDLLWLVSISASAPGLVFSGEMLLAALPNSKPERGPRPTFTVLIPAHDEALGITETVRHLLAQLRSGDRLIVIADNCTDNTAELAKLAGAEVLIRNDPLHRGKGYALSFGSQAIHESPPEVVIIMDADCRVTQGSLGDLAALAARHHRPTQAVYLMNRPSAGSPLGGISAFAFLVRNWLRPRGLKRLGFPCLLTGTGMAFPWDVYRDAPPTHSFLVEDLLLGHELAMRGTAPLLDESTVVVSELPQSEAAGFKQRRRWEHGQLSVLKTITPRLLGAGLKTRRLGLFALAIDGFVPPLALLVSLQVGCALALSTAFAFGAPGEPVLFSLGTLAMMAALVVWAWLRHGRALLSFRDLLFIPRYVLWKIPLYKTFLRSGAHDKWERTERS